MFFVLRISCNTILFYIDFITTKCNFKDSFIARKEILLTFLLTLKYNGDYNVYKTIMENKVMDKP